MRRVFDTLSAGYSLTTAIHAASVRGAIAAVCEGSRVSDEDASRFDLVLYIERFGEDEGTFWRRLKDVYELDRVVNGSPEGRTLYRWIDTDDRFEVGEPPRHVAADKALVKQRAAALQELAGQGATSADAVARLVAEHGSGG